MHNLRLLPFKQVKMPWSESDLSGRINGPMCLNYVIYEKVLFKLSNSSPVLMGLAFWYNCTAPMDNNVSHKIFARNSKGSLASKYFNRMKAVGTRST